MSAPHDPNLLEVLRVDRQEGLRIAEALGVGHHEAVSDLRYWIRLGKALDEVLARLNADRFTRYSGIALIVLRQVYEAAGLPMPGE